MKGLFAGARAIKIILAAVLYIVLSEAIAQPPTCTPGSSRTRIMTVNGVWNPMPDDADKIAIGLANALASGGGTGASVEGFWSPGEGNGSLSQTTGSLNDVLQALILQAWPRKGLEFVNTVFNSMGQWAGFHQINVQSNQRAYIDELKLRLVDGLNKGDKFVLVPHSRGNLLVDIALSELKADGVSLTSVGVVGLASPDTSQAVGNSLNITRTDDKVIRAVNVALGNTVVPTNFTPAQQYEGSGHEFVKDYLDPSVHDAAGKSIRDEVVAAVNTVKDAVESCGLDLAITPPSAQIKVGETFQFTVVAVNPARNNASAPPPRLTWTSSAPANMAIGTTGTIGAAAFGNVIGVSPAAVWITIKDEVSKKTLRADVIVDSAYTVRLSPSSVQLAEGETRKITATLQLNGQDVLPQPDFEWVSSNSGIAEVSAAGVIMGKAKGTTTINAHAIGTSANASVAVTVETVASEFLRVEKVVEPNQVLVYFHFKNIPVPENGFTSLPICTLSYRWVYEGKVINEGVNACGALTVTLSSGPPEDQRVQYGGYGTGVSSQEEIEVTLPSGKVRFTLTVP